MNNTKERYSQVYYKKLRHFKKVVKQSSAPVAKNYINNIISDIENKQKQSCEKTELDLILTVINNQYTNFFISTKELSDFFINTKVKNNIIDHIKDILINNSNIHDSHGLVRKYNEFEKEITEDADIKEFVGCIHSKSLDKSIFFVFDIVNDIEVSLFCICDDDFVKFNFFGNELALSFNFLQRDDIYGYMSRLVLNMIFYMESFPDKITNGPPDEICDKLNKSNSKTISVSNEIAIYLREVSPHLRRGHFRYLQSDFYKEKKGQTIFVRAAFIHGEAKTILK